MRKINVLYITAQGNIIGGGQVSLLTLLKHLDRERFTSVVILPSAGSLFQALRKINIETRIIALKSLKKLHLFSFISAIAKLFCLVKKEKIDIIHCNAAASRESIYSLVVAKLARIPFIYHARVLESSKWIEKFLASFSTKIIAISEKVKDKFSFVKDKNKLTKICNAVDLNEFNPEIKQGEKIKQEFRISSEVKIVGTVGRLYPLKGFDVFLKASGEVIKKMPKTTFLIVGEDASFGSYRNKLERLTEVLGLKGEVIFTGFRLDVPELLGAMDVFVLPSLEDYESFGRVILEAMAMSKPVVATRSGGVTEIVEDGRTGILIPPGDVETMAAAIIALLKDKEKAKLMGARGRKRAEELFSIKAHVKKIEQVYEILLKNE